MTLHDTFLPRDDKGRHTDLLQDEGGDGGEGDQSEDGDQADHGGGGQREAHGLGVASATETLTLVIQI